METKPGLTSLKLVPARGGIIVDVSLPPPNDGVRADPPYVFTDHDELCRFLYTYFVDTEAELKKRAEDA